MKTLDFLQVLIIEDNLGDFLLTKEYLEEQIRNVSVSHVKKYKEAFDLLSNNQIKFDIILLDLTLPDSTGEGLITDVVNLQPETPIIVLTGFADIDFSVRTISLKVSDYLLKDDITSISLYKSIKYSIERKRANLLLEESEKRYSNLFQLSPQPMWIIDIEKFNFIQVNKAAIDHYGYSEEEFLKLSLFDIAYDDYSFSEKMERANFIAHKEGVYKGRIRHIKKNRELIEVDIYTNLISINDAFYESAIAIDVTEKIKLEHKITKAIIKTQEDERYEIGTELHDNVCQILASSQLSLDMLGEQINPESKQWVEKSKQFITLALDEIRNISHRLAPSFFDFATIEDTFQELIDSFNLERKFETILNFDITSFKNKISSDIQLNLYRILQEQLRNISKYASAKTITIEVFSEKNNLILNIKDDGVGFNLEAVKRGIGLANIRRRAELFSGTMEIISAPGKGCLITVVIPIGTKI
jgi:PAS domain S-box-containing protein